MHLPVFFPVELVGVLAAGYAVVLGLALSIAGAGRVGRDLVRRRSRRTSPAPPERVLEG
jgi:hypothetical protein